MAWNCPNIDRGSGFFVFATVVLLAWARPGLAEPALLPAFPGAQGWGALSQGGRGGRIIKVTNLNAKGPGSFSAACAAHGPRIVVFEVSGKISGSVYINHPNITIAGQTAPGAGITLRGSILSWRKGLLHNVIIRFIRLRPPPGTEDALQLPMAQNIIIDHVTASWAKDETIDLNHANYVTVQWCTIEESDWNPKTDHNCGMIFGGVNKGISVHHNLFAHHRSRNPMMAHGPADMINNVVYDFRDGFTQYENKRFPPKGGFNIIGNYFKAGPSDPHIFPFNFTSMGEYYLRDNYIHGLGVIQDPWAEAHKHHGLRFYAKKGTKLKTPVQQRTAITTHPSRQAYELVLTQAGCFPRDVVTRRTLRDVRTGAGAWGRHEPENIMAGLMGFAPPRDADDDGMPDIWEITQGLDPNAQDHNTTMPSGYTAIEDYINELAQMLVESYTTIETEGSVADRTSVQNNPRILIDGKTATFQPDATNLDLRLIRDMIQLETIHLNLTQITDTGLEHLTKLSNLRMLNLKDTNVGDDGLIYLKSLSALKALSLAGTLITDEGLDHLKSLTNLLLLDLPSHIADAAIQDLKRSLHDVRIERQVD